MPLSRQKASAVARVRVWAATNVMSRLLPWTELTSERPQRPRPRMAARIMGSARLPWIETSLNNDAYWVALGVTRGGSALHSTAIIGVGQSAYTRRPAPGQSTHTFIRDAVVAALADAGVAAHDVQGMAVASFSLVPDTAVDLAWKLGLSLRWLMQDTNGGSSAMNMLGHALRAVETGGASVILVTGGDATGLGGYAKVAANFNIVTQLHLAPLGHGGPNGVYALVTSRQMKTYGLQKSDYGHLAIAQRAWAAHNPYAVYRTPMTMEDYLAAPLVADPLSRYD